MYGWKEGAPHYFCKDFTETTVQEIENIANGKTSLTKMNKEELKDIIKRLTAELGRGTTVVEFDKPNASSLHPTMKPIELVAHFIENSSIKGDLVIDFFGGSGSTLIASELTGRRCNTMELDERYAQVIVQRWCDFTGIDTITINGNKVSWSKYKGDRDEEE
jgi:DNA modification methylase